MWLHDGDDHEILSELHTFFGVKPEQEIVSAYLNGYLPELLIYEKLSPHQPHLTALERYLIGYESFIKFNEKVTQYYDIFRACRFTLLLQLFHQRLPFLKNINGIDRKLEQLKCAKTFDEFESIFFEVFVATRYAQKLPTSKITFIEETSNKSPDLEIIENGKSFFVECKKINRINLDHIEIRDRVRVLHTKVSEWARVNRISFLFEVSFGADPRKIDEALYLKGCKEACEKGVFRSEAFEVNVQRLVRAELKDYKLNPSPGFFYERYNYRDGGEWFGLLPFSEISFKYFSENTLSRASSWIDEIGFECILKWKISSPEVVHLYQKLNFNLIFDGLEQLKQFGNQTILHVCFERNGAIGHRRRYLLKLYEKMNESKRDDFSWIVFNELCFDVSLKGRFDLIEHSHPISGPGRFSHQLIVESIFTNPVTTDQNTEFGIGASLPDIDDLLDE